MSEKKVFSSREDNTKRIGIYKSEIENPDFTFTIINDDYFKGRVFKIYPEIIKRNYEIKEFNFNGRIHEKYVVAVEDIVEVVIELEDEAIDKMTIRDFYAIVRNSPCSNKSWLNKIIKDNTK